MATSRRGCVHPLEDHVNVTVGEDNGVVLCRYVGCECFSAWDDRVIPRPLTADSKEVARLRDDLWTKRGKVPEGFLDSLVFIDEPVTDFPPLSEP